MNAILLSTLASATAFAADMVSRLAYPKNGTEIGGGRHTPDPVDGGAFKTRRPVRVLKHPSLAQWAYPVNAEVQTALTGPESATVVGLAVAYDTATQLEIP